MIEMFCSESLNFITFFTKTNRLILQKLPNLHKSININARIIVVVKGEEGKAIWLKHEEWVKFQNFGMTSDHRHFALT
jgi:hypothetical protein